MNLDPTGKQGIDMPNADAAAEQALNLRDPVVGGYFDKVSSSLETESSYLEKYSWFGSGKPMDQVCPQKTCVELYQPQKFPACLAWESKKVFSNHARQIYS